MVGRLHPFHSSRKLLALAILGLTHGARAQDAVISTLADAAPASTRIFVNIHRLHEAEAALRQTHAWPLISFLGFKPPERKEIDLKSVLVTTFHLPSSIPPADLARCEIGMAAESWSRIADPTVLIRTPDAAIPAGWFPAVTARDADAHSARVFRNEDGRFVCLRDNIVALAPRGNDWTQLGALLRAMAGGDAEVLGKTPEYRELAAYLPANPMATVYYAARHPALSGASAGERQGTKFALGIYSRSGTVDFALRGFRRASKVHSSISTAGVERLLKLPQTTLGAYLTSVDWTSLLADGHDHPSALQRYLRLLLELAKEDDAGQPQVRVGSQIILAWGQDFSPDGSIPQLAALVECPDAAMLVGHAGRTAASLVRILSTLELRDVSPELVVRNHNHLGVAIMSVPLRGFAEKSRFPWVKMLGELEPCWAGSGNWFIVTLTPDHMHRILDAQIGFLGSLADQRKYHALRERPQQNTAIALFQGTLAAATMRQWEGKLRGADLAAAFARIRPRAAPEEPDRLGVDVSDEDHFGMVEVGAVAPSSPSDGRLLPGDRIFGVDGRLLELVAPVEDLGRWWEAAAPGSIHRVRVLRDGEVIEPEVTRPFDEVGLEDLFAKPIELLRELAQLSDVVPLATLQIHNADDHHFSALLSLRIAPDTKKP